MKNLHPLYHHYLEVLDIAFQPIVDIHSGVTYGVEALLRGTDDLGYDSIHSFFDALYQDGVLYSFDLNLREKVVEKFCKIEGYESLKLFYNLDNRLLDMADFAKGNTKRILKKFGVDHKTSFLSFPNATKS
jgi:EAL domain-containing protein (putative c-di-GMP-specific phosphodiesterase class I)